MKYRSLILFILGFGSLHFAAEAQKLDVPLLQDELITEYFTSNEISTLESIVDFFDKQMLDVCAQEDKTIPGCYRSFLEGVNSDLKNNNVVLNLAVEPQNEFVQTIEGESLEIWHHPKGKENHFLDLIPGGKYHSFLKNLASKKESFRSYTAALSNAGGLSPSMVADFMYSYDKFELSNRRDRLILAIHYIVLNSRSRNPG